MNGQEICGWSIRGTRVYRRCGASEKSCVIGKRVKLSFDRRFFFQALYSINGNGSVSRVNYSIPLQ